MEEKKALIITYDFPPEFGGGTVIRTVKFTKYLRETDWKPVVLTTKRHDVFMADKSFLKDLDGVTIYRARDYLWNFVKMIQNILKIFQREHVSGLRSKKKNKGENNHPLKSFADSFTDIIFFPDKRWFWVFSAVLCGFRIIRREKVEVMFTTFPSAVSHLVGFMLKKICRIRWVVDFRDLWVDNTIFKGKTKLRQKLDRWLESKIISNSDYVVTSTESQAEYFRIKYAKKEVRCISNGFDEDDFTGTDIQQHNTSKNSKFIVSYIGKVLGGKNFKSVFQAFHEIDRRISERIELRLIGYMDEKTINAISEYKLSGIVRLFGEILHNKAIEMMLNSDALLLVLLSEEDGYRAVPGKVFEYIRAKKPVIAICPAGSELWHLINNNKIGICVEEMDTDGIKDAVITMFYDWEKGKLQENRFNSDLFEKFDRGHLTMKLVQVFDEISTSNVQEKP